MSVTLDLEPQVIEPLAKEAAALGLPVEQLAAEILRRHVAASGGPERTAAFRRAMAESMKENEELLRRLAK